jgi:asparagine synthase (glutamine-hydrolysing)
MKPRYLLAVARASHIPGEPGRLASLTGLEPVLTHPKLIALANAACGRHVLGDRGLVLGTLFRRQDRARTIDMLAPREVETLLADPVGQLLASLWGGYVCAIEMGEGIRLLRDPSASLPCYHVETASMTLLASDMDLLLAAGYRAAAVDWLALGRHHFTSGLPTPDTALAGAKELMPGCSIDLTTRGAGDQKMRWSPWDHVEGDPALSGGAREERLHRMVTHCTAAWTSLHDRFLASVSGGVDSSIVATCLARSSRDIHCLTLYTDDPAGDERGWATALCEHLGLQLHTHAYLLEHVDIDRALNPHLPRPIGRALGQAFEHAHLAVAREIGAQAFVTGIGGDNVFCYSQSGAAIADRWMRHGVGAAMGTLQDVCRQTGCGPVAALRAAIKARGKRRYPWRATPDFLRRELCAAFSAADFRHPWLDAPPRALPGKAAHIASLLRLHHLLEPGRSTFAPVLYPLISQPIVELCLGIPSWEWRAGGVDRAVARHAFAGDLPDAILRRRIKGGPDGFSTAILRAHRTQIRERLVEGRLARHGIVDREALSLRLADTASLLPAEQTIILDLLDTEAWAASWECRLATPTATVGPQAYDAASSSD